ncbi:MAG: tetratricopeptide repeat protein [Myxococcota bacterium]
MIASRGSEGWGKLWLSGLLVLGAFGSSAAAQSSEDVAIARQAFQAGTEAYEAGNFERALLEFHRAYELTQSSDILYNIATVADRARRDREALEAYQSYLEVRPDTEDRAHIEGRVRVLRRELDARNEPDVEARPERPAPEIRTEVVYVDRTIIEDEGPGAIPWVLAGSGAALAVAGGVMLVLSAMDISAVEDPGEGAEWRDVEGRYDRAQLLGPIGSVLVGVGGAVALAGVLWGLLTGPTEVRSQEARLQLHPLGIGGWF